MSARKSGGEGEAYALAGPLAEGDQMVLLLNAANEDMTITVSRKIHLPGMKLDIRYHIVMRRGRCTTCGMREGFRTCSKGVPDVGIY